MHYHSLVQTADVSRVTELLCSLRYNIVFVSRRKYAETFKKYITTFRMKERCSGCSSCWEGSDWSQSACRWCIRCWCLVMYLGCRWPYRCPSRRNQQRGVVDDFWFLFTVHREVPWRHVTRLIHDVVASSSSLLRAIRQTFTIGFLLNEKRSRHCAIVSVSAVDALFTHFSACCRKKLFNKLSIVACCHTHAI